MFERHQLPIALFSARQTQCDTSRRGKKVMARTPSIVGRGEKTLLSDPEPELRLRRSIVNWQDEITHEEGKHRHPSGELSYARLCVRLRLDHPKKKNSSLF